MKTLFYMGRNDQNLSRLSWKIWRIKREGKRLTTWWGAAVVSPSRRPMPKYKRLQSKSWTFRTEQAAREDERRRIREKLNGGYERNPR
jgi:hypothetical protein